MVLTKDVSVGIQVPHIVMHNFVSLVFHRCCCTVDVKLLYFNVNK